MAGEDPWVAQRKLLGEFIRTQRTLAKMSLRDLSARTAVSNPYLSQIERGLHEPSVRVIKAIAHALNLSAETLLAEAGLIDDEEEDASSEAGPGGTESAIMADPLLNQQQKSALLGVYRSYRDAKKA